MPPPVSSKRRLVIITTSALRPKSRPERAPNELLGGSRCHIRVKCETQGRMGPSRAPRANSEPVSGSPSPPPLSSPHR
eukprot:3299036-Alexandrium_andersonii.AAC.1